MPPTSPTLTSNANVAAQTVSASVMGINAIVSIEFVPSSSPSQSFPLFRLSELFAFQTSRTAPQKIVRMFLQLDFGP